MDEKSVRVRIRLALPILSIMAAGFVALARTSAYDAAARRGRPFSAAVVYLTNTERHKPMSGQAGDEIEITPEMVEAGYDILSLRMVDVTDLNKPDYVKSVLRDIYRAMAVARSDGTSESG